MLSAERVKQNMTLGELKRRSGLRCSIVSVSRKLSGRQPISTRELEVLARALGITVRVEHTTITLGASKAA